jgi:phosphoglycerol transferase
MVRERCVGLQMKQDHELDYKNRERSLEILLYTASVCSSVLILIKFFRLWSTDLHVPFSYQSDALATHAAVKGIIDNGWIWRNQFVGMPFGQSSLPFDFQNGLTNNLHLLALKALSFLSHDHAMIINAYYLLGFPLTAICALYAFRHMGLNRWCAFAGSIIFAFLPYHFVRSTIHLCLSSYYLIPLSLLSAYWISTRSIHLVSLCKSERVRVHIRDSKSIVALSTAVLTAVGGEYYAFFTCFFLVFAGILGFIRYRAVDTLINAALIVSIITAIFVASLVPSFLYHQKHGNNPIVAVRSSCEAEHWGLKIRYLLLPIDDHRVSWLARLKNACNCTPPFPALKDWERESLGFFGAFGLLVLMKWLLFKRSGLDGRDELEEAKNALSSMTGAALLLANVGGFSYLFACMISPSIRCYNRIYPFVAFMSVWAGLIVFQEISRRFSRSRLAKVSFVVALLCLVLISLFDQTSPGMRPDFQKIREEYMNDRAFVRQIESCLPPNSMVFQLPALGFPEVAPYGLFKAYLHSRTLKWSFGAINGRPAGEWQLKVVAKPLNEMLKALVTSGFSGIYVDRELYGDKVLDLEMKMSTILGIEPIVAPDNTKAFFDLRNFAY